MGTSQKRDAEMDRLLRAVLRPSSRGRDSAGVDPNPGECPDAGLLAASVEGSLTAAEQSALDAHMATCGRCQDALAILSHELPGEAVEARATGWFTWVTEPRLRWLVPISAVATVAVVFLATRPLIAPERQESGASVGTEVAQMAQAQPRPAELPSARPQVPREQPAAALEKDDARGALGRRQAATSMTAPPPSKNAVDVLADAPPPSAETRDKRMAEPVAEMMAARVRSDEKQEQPAAPLPAAPPAGAQVAVATPTLREELRRREPTTTVVAAPDGLVRWRFGPGGRIWRSLDAGSNWHSQLSGVSADLTAGAAPSATTCWAVGAAGLVLLTVDGESWVLLPFPLSADLTAVQASSARAATVTTRDGRRFDTIDGGATWTIRQGPQ